MKEVKITRRFYPDNEMLFDVQIKDEEGDISARSCIKTWGQVQEYLIDNEVSHNDFLAATIKEVNS